MSTVLSYDPLTRQVVADTLDVTPRTLENWRSGNLIPAAACIGRRVYWHPAVFWGWLDAMLRGCDWHRIRLSDQPQGAAEPAREAVLPFKPVTREAAAGKLSITVRTLESWYADGAMPQPVSIGRRLYWHPAIFYGWLDAKLNGTGSESSEHAPPPQSRPELAGSAAPPQPVLQEAPAVKVASVAKPKATRQGLTSVARARARDAAKLAAMNGGAAQLENAGM